MGPEHVRLVGDSTINGSITCTGSPANRPAVRPGGINIGQDPEDAQRILLTWQSLSCQDLNSRFVRYVIMLGRRDGQGSNRIVTTTSLVIRSSSTIIDTGLGFLTQGVEYFFKIAAENANGVGPFSMEVFAVTALVATGK